MTQKDPRQIQAGLAMPFAPEDLEWRLQRTFEYKGEMKGIAVPYVTNRAIMNRLDEVVGPENWYNEFKPWHDGGKKQAQLCGISIRYEDGFITKWDGAEDSAIESVKGGLSDSMKRAAVQWGIGRVLYNMDSVFVDVEQRGKSWYIKKDQHERMDGAYLQMLRKLNLTPAPAGGLRTRAVPNDSGQSKPLQQEIPQGKPAEKPQKDNVTYIVRNLRVNKGISSINTKLALESSRGERVEAFLRGEHPELTKGVILTDVELETRQNDTVIYYMLVRYRIMDDQPQAA